MDAVHREGHSAVGKPPHSKVEPALGVALVVSALGVAGSPDAVVIVGSAHNSVHVARVELAAKEYFWFPRF